METLQADRTEFFTYVLSVSFFEPFDKIIIQQDSEFELQRLAMFASLDFATLQTESSRVIPQVNFNILDTATGRTIFSDFTAMAEIFGDGRVPFVLPTTHLFAPGSQLQMRYDPVDPGNDFDASSIWLAFIGRKLFTL